MSDTLAYILEPLELVKSTDQDNLLIIDLCKPEQYVQAHIPGAISVNYASLIVANPPVMGLLPEKQQLQAFLSSVGINPGTHVVAYDDEGGGKAARLLWTLAAIGHSRMSLLNGGFHAWSAEGFPMDSNPVAAQTSTEIYPFEYQSNVIADQAYIIEHLEDPSVVCLDARSEAEYVGHKKIAERAGHIPGAKHMDWMSMMDQTKNLRLKNNEELSSMLQSLQIEPSQEVIVYCQTHHRSALSFVALTALGYSKVKGYPGSWSDWGNSSSTPIE